jgi:nucleoside-diphosphate-sugar epimerase
MKTILVTGGVGFVGSHACKALARAGFLPVVFDSSLTHAHCEPDHDRAPTRGHSWKRMGGGVGSDLTRGRLDGQSDHRWLHVD